MIDGNISKALSFLPQTKQDEFRGIERRYCRSLVLWKILRFLRLIGKRKLIEKVFLHQKERLGFALSNPLFLEKYNEQLIYRMGECP